MYQGRIVFSQLMDFLPRYEFDKCVRRYRGNYRARSFSCYDQFLCMAFAQLTYRESLRDIETCLRAMQSKLYHAGICSSVSRSTLADANEKRKWHIYADFAHVLIGIARRLYARDSFGVELQNVAYVLDSTTIDLCLSLFPWAHFQSTKGAVKLHTLIDLRGNIPCFIHISTGKLGDLAVLDQLVPEPGAFYIMDRGYIDFKRLYVFTKAHAFFVIRPRKNQLYSRRSSRPVDKTTGLRSDQIIVLKGVRTAIEYPVPLRRVSYYDAERKKRIVFLTNNLTLPSLTIAQLYRCRWQVELFFKWIKQYLRIKAFFGTSENAVKTQIWIAITIYVLVAIVKKELKIDRSLGEILQIISITLFEKIPAYQVLTETALQNEHDPLYNQLNLFNS
ncbi:IS4 family transposase [bacterium]|nr:IS4 family transposase [bacterium]